MIRCLGMCFTALPATGRAQEWQALGAAALGFDCETGFVSVGIIMD